MADLKTALSKTFALESKIETLFGVSTFDRYDDLSDLDIDRTDSDQLFLLDQLQAIIMNLWEAKNKIAYLKHPVKETSHLHKNRQGRYEMASGHDFTSGDVIEVLVDNGHHLSPYWARTSVEHNGKDYYLVHYRDICMDGLLVRRR